MLTWEQRKSLESICDRFEDAWKKGERPAVEDLVVGLDETLRNPALRELLELELHYRRRNGERPCEDEYSHRIPEDVLCDAFATRESLEADVETGQLPPSESSTAAGLPFLSGYEILERIGQGGFSTSFPSFTGEEMGRGEEMGILIKPEADS